MNPVPHQIARSSELPLFQIRRAAGKKRGAEKCEKKTFHFILLSFRFIGKHNRTEE